MCQSSVVSARPRGEFHFCQCSAPFPKCISILIAVCCVNIIHGSLTQSASVSNAITAPNARFDLTLKFRSRFQFFFCSFDLGMAVIFSKRWGKWKIGKNEEKTTTADEIKHYNLYCLRRLFGRPFEKIIMCKPIVWVCASVCASNSQQPATIRSIFVCCVRCVWTFYTPSSSRLPIVPGINVHHSTSQPFANVLCIWASTSSFARFADAHNAVIYGFCGAFERIECAVCGGVYSRMCKSFEKKNINFTFTFNTSSARN